MTAKAYLVHWNQEEWEAICMVLSGAGWAVKGESEDGGKAYQGIREFGPDVVVISLNRLPSHSHALARSLQETKATRNIPLVFMGSHEHADRLEAAQTKFPQSLICNADTLLVTLSAITDQDDG
jgi:DNA-binding response OmpR family regulator